MASRSPGNDVYTVMTLIAALMLIAAIVYVFMRNGELYETPAWDPTTRADFHQPELISSDRADLRALARV